jgi:hypothetical protein
MRVNTTLINLKLEKCDFEEKDIPLLAQVFEVHKFDKIELQNNKFRDVDAVKLTRSMHASKNLRELDMSSCSIGDATATAIAELVVDKPIAKLMLGNNLIGNAGAIALSKVFTKHASIVAISLEGNGEIQHEGKAALSHMVQKNLQLQEIKFGDFRLNSEALASMRLLYLYGLGGK